MSRTRSPLWDDLYYIELRAGSKMPARPWGGFDQDLGAAPNVLRPHELEPGRRYGYVAHAERLLGVLDLDLYKDEAPGDPDAVSTSHEPLLVESPSGGLHMPFTAPAGSVARTRSEARAECGPSRRLRVRGEFEDWVDLKGELGGGYCVAPFGTEYGVTGGSAPTAPAIADPGDEGELASLATCGGEPLLECADEPGLPAGVLESDPPGDVLQALPGGYAAGERHEHPFHGSSSGANFYVFDDGDFWYCYRHECGGTLLHLVGMDNGHYDCGGWQRMDDGERAEKHRTVRREAIDAGMDIETGGRRFWSADTDGLAERLGAVQ